MPANEYNQNEFESITTDDLNISGNDFVLNGNVANVRSINIPKQALGTTASTSYTSVGTDFGSSVVPDQGTIVVRFSAVLNNDTADETTFARPYYQEPGSASTVLNNLEISETSTGFPIADSGWQTAPFTAGSVIRVSNIESKVSGGTGNILEAGFSIGVQL